MRSISRFTAFTVILITLLQSSTAMASIPAGLDCWATECGRTATSFCDNPIPADFFEPGSEPFSGEVRLGGDPSQSDTQIRRLQDMSLPNPGDSATIPIEIVELQLVSCEPITVTTNGNPIKWDVQVTLSNIRPPAGSMTVTKSHAEGGVFVSDYFLQLRFIFTKVDDPSQVRVLDTGEAGFPPEQMMTLGHGQWVHQMNPGVGSPPCGVNFVPGIQEILKGKYAGSQCCAVTCHAGATATHCVVQSINCSGCPSGACCYPSRVTGRCHVQRAGHLKSAGETCESRGGAYGGDGTSCADTDNDGLADIMETNHCCADTTGSCHLGTNPTNPDTDDDGWWDGLELKQGSDPCH